MHGSPCYHSFHHGPFHEGYAGRVETDNINASWDHIQDMSNCNNSVASVIIPVLNSSPTWIGHGGFPASRPALAEEPVTLKTQNENLQRRSAAQQARFQQTVDNEIY